MSFSKLSNFINFFIMTVKTWIKFVLMKTFTIKRIDEKLRKGIIRNLE